MHWRTAITPHYQLPPDIAPTTGIAVSLPGEDPRDLASLSSKAVYSSIILAKDHQSTAYSRWTEGVKNSIKVNNEAEWKTFCLSSFKTVRETKIQSLQYKILNRILPCNAYLKQLRIREDDSCSFCKQADTIEHFLFLCPRVQGFWGNVCAWFGNSVDLQLQHIDAKEFVFGTDTASRWGKIVNFITLQVKHFVHRQKLFHHGDLRLIHFLQELKVKLKCEKFLSYQEGKSARFRKWQAILAALG